MVYNPDLSEGSNDSSLMWYYSQFGDIKEIVQSPDRPSEKFVTYYDTRHATQALQAMNRADQLGKLPPHITPQQAASMAYIAGSSPGLLQLAALQLQHQGNVREGGCYRNVLMGCKNPNAPSHLCSLSL